MDEQKPLENKQGEPGKKIEKSEYSFKEILLPISETLFYFTEDNVVVQEGPK